MPRMFTAGPPGGNAQNLLEEVSKGLDVLWVVLPTDTRGVYGNSQY